VDSKVAEIVCCINFPPHLTRVTDVPCSKLLHNIEMRYLLQTI